MTRSAVSERDKNANSNTYIISFTMILFFRITFHLYKDQEPHGVEGYRIRGIVIMSRGKEPPEVKEKKNYLVRTGNRILKSELNLPACALASLIKEILKKIKIKRYKSSF